MVDGRVVVEASSVDQLKVLGAGCFAVVRVGASGEMAIVEQLSVGEACSIVSCSLVCYHICNAPLKLYIA